MYAAAYPRRLPPTPGLLAGWAQIATTLGLCLSPEHSWELEGARSSRAQPEETEAEEGVAAAPSGAKSGPSEVRTAQAQAGGRPACPPRGPASLGPAVAPRLPSPGTRLALARGRPQPAHPGNPPPSGPGSPPARPGHPPFPQARGRPACLPARTHPAPQRNLTS